MIILGNAGLITVIVTATSSLSSSSGFWLGIDIAALLAGILAIYLIARHTPLARLWERFVEKHVANYSGEEVEMTEDLLHIREGYGLQRIFVKEGSPFAGKSLVQINTPENKFWIVGIERVLDWISMPKSSETIQSGDRLVVYGEMSHLKKLFARP
jgi:hypothetical protein